MSLDQETIESLQSLFDNHPNTAKETEVQPVKDDAVNTKSPYEILLTALTYAKMGIGVFPVREREYDGYNNEGIRTVWGVKTPYTINGVKDATTNQSTIARYWSKYPNAGIGMACQDNLFVVDIDAKDGISGFKTFMDLGISIAETWQTLTPSGGLHIIWSGKGRNSTSSKTKIDTRGDGGYVVAPPSKILVDGIEREYISLTDMSKRPTKIPTDAFELLGLLDRDKKSKNRVSLPTTPELIETVRKMGKKLPSLMAYEYDVWTAVGMSLHTLGDDGFDIWQEWTNRYYRDIKPNSTRRNTLRRRWNTFARISDVTLGTFFHHAKEGRNYE